MRLHALLVSIIATVAAKSVVPPPVPSTFGFINKSYTGTRFTGKTVMVLGGTSGIGFAAAAMLVQECAQVVLVGRNPSKGELAATTINTEASRAHCHSELHRESSNVTQRPAARFVQASTLDRRELREAFRSESVVHAVVNTAGIPGWTNLGLPDIPDEAWLGEEDAIHNNLYGTINIMTEPACRSLGFLPSIVNVASVQGLTPSPGMLMYGASKAGMISATNSIAAAYSGSLRANVVAPGLISTPLTWNQVRSYRMASNGTATNAYPKLQFGFQCVRADGTLIENGDCEGGGTGYECPCPDVMIEDPRIDAIFKGYPIVDPREIGLSILFLASDSIKAQAVNGETFVVPFYDWASAQARELLCGFISPTLGLRQLNGHHNEQHDYDSHGEGTQQLHFSLIAVLQKHFSLFCNNLGPKISMVGLAGYRQADFGRLENGSFLGTPPNQVHTALTS